jgi:transposase
MLIALLDEFFPEYSTVWKDVTCPTSLELLKIYAFPSDIMSASRERLLLEVKLASNGKEGKILTDALIQAAERSVGVKEGLKSARLRILNLINELVYFEDIKAEIETELEAAMAPLELGEILQSMPGVATIISSAFLGEVGDISRFDNWKQVRSLAGLNLVENSSGKHKSKTKVSKRGRPYLRHMLFMAGDAGVLHNAEMRELYYYFRRRPSNPLNYYQAIVAVGLKVMRILFHMAKTGQKYDSSKALGEVRKTQIAKVA